MRFVLRLLIITCLVQVSGQSQSLADLARLERARRAGLPGPGQLITSEEAGLSQVLLSFGEAGVTGEASEEEEGDLEEGSREPGAPTEAADVQETDTAGDAARIDAQRDRVSELEDRIVVHRLEVSRLEDLFTAAVASGRERSEAQVQHAAAQSELQNLEAELVEAETLLETLLGAGAP